jgi:single-strand DNA-binding protein
MANFNKVILLGNLTRDPEVRYTQGGQSVAKFGMAINRRYSVNGEQREQTCFVDLTAWGKQAEVLGQYAGKGRALLVEGRLDYQTWEAKDGGGKRSKLEVVVENFQFVGSRDGVEGGGGGGGGGGGRRGGSREAPEAGGEAAADDFDGIPF